MHRVVGGEYGGKAYLTLELSNKQSLKNLPGFVRVADILECFCRVLASNVEKDFFTTSVDEMLVNCLRPWSHPRSKVGSSCDNDHLEAHGYHVPNASKKATYGCSSTKLDAL